MDLFDRSTPGLFASTVDDDNIPNSAATPDSTKVLGTYPFTHYTPSSRVARHLSNLQLESPASTSTADSYAHLSADLLKLDSLADEDSAFVHANNMEALKLLNQFGSARVDKEAVKGEMQRMRTSSNSSNNSSIPLYRQQPMSISPAYPHPSPSSASSLVSFMYPIAPSFFPTPSNVPENAAEATKDLDRYLEGITQQRKEQEEEEEKRRRERSRESESPGIMIVDGSSPDPLSFSNSPLKRKRDQMQMVASGSGSGQQYHSPTKPSRLSQSVSSMDLARNGSGSSLRRSAGGGVRMVPVVEIPVHFNGGTYRTRSRSPTKKDKGARVLYKEDEGNGEMDLDELEDREDSDYYGGGGGGGGSRAGKKKAPGGLRTPFMSSRLSNITVGSSQSKVDLQQRLVTLIENLFEAEDSLPADVTSDDLATSKYFYIEEDDTGEGKIRLDNRIVRELSLLFQKLGRTGLGQQANGKGKDNEGSGVNEKDIKRLLAILQRSFVGEKALRAFPRDGFTGLRGEGSPVKGKGRGRKSVTPKTKVEGTRNESDLAVDEEAIEKCKSVVDKIWKGLSAAECSLAILGTSGLSKRLLSEDSIYACLAEIDAALNEVVSPVLEGVSDASGVESTLLALVLKGTSNSASSLRRSIENVTGTALFHQQRFRSLLETPNKMLSEEAVTKGVFMVLRFLGSGDAGDGAKNVALSEALGGKLGVQSLRVEAMSLLKILYASSPGQSDWIMDEILVCVEKLFGSKRGEGQQRLREGKSISAASALLIDLIQNCARGVRQQISNPRKPQDAEDDSSDQADTSAETEEDPEVRQVAGIYSKHLAKARNAASQIARSLLQKASTVSGGTGRARTAADNENKNVLDVFVADQLTVLHLPEWPGAAVGLEYLVRTMLAVLDTSKGNTASPLARQVAIEHLSSISARLRSIELSTREDSPLASVEGTVTQASLESFQQRREAYSKLFRHLFKGGGEDATMRSALDLSLCIWSQELVAGRKGLPAALEKAGSSEAEEGASVEDRMANLSGIQGAIESELVACGKNLEDDTLFDVVAADQVRIMQTLSLKLQAKGMLSRAFEAIFRPIVASLESNVVGTRTKALKGLTSIILVDPDVLLRGDVKQGLSERFSDSSPLVRDTAVELVSKYLVLRPDLARNYYPLISQRSTDTGLSVRKHVINLLRSMYTLLEDRSFKVDICCRLINMVGDDDDGIKDLAIQTLCNFWFPGIQLSKKYAPAPTKSTPAETADMMMAVVHETAIVPEMAAHMDRLVSVMKIWATEAPEQSLKEFSAMADYLGDSLIDGSEETKASVNWMRTMWLLVQAKPAIMTVNRAAPLVKHLRLASSSDRVVASLVMKIFCCSIPAMPRTAQAFAKDVAPALIELVTHPVSLDVLQDALACWSTLVTHIMPDYTYMLRLLKNVDTKLKQYLQGVLTKGWQQKDLKAVESLMHIEALLVAFSNLDKVKETDEVARRAINQITTGSIFDHVHALLMRFWHAKVSPDLRQAIVSCLGHMYKETPSAMITEEAAAVVDSVLDGTHPDSEQLKAPMLKAMQRVLASQVEKNPEEKNAPVKRGTKKDVKVNMDDLIGTTTDFADSGYSSSIAQRFAEPILSLALDSEEDISEAAFDILSLTVTQGWGHPLQAVPAIVGMETSVDTSKADRAMALHTYIAQKNDMVNTHQLECARKAFEYQSSIGANPDGAFHGTPPKAIFFRWFEVIERKRQWRNEFLKALCRPFNIDTTDTKISRMDVSFARFLADNLSLLDYKTVEEVMLVIKQMTSVLSIAGAEVYQMMRRARLVEDLKIVLVDELDLGDDEDMELEDLPRQSALPLTHQSAIIGIAILLKDRLKKVHSFSEAKCNKWASGKQSSSEAKMPANRRLEPAMMDWDPLPAILSQVATAEQFREHQAAFIKLMEQDGLHEVPDEDD